MIRSINYSIVEKRAGAEPATVQYKGTCVGGKPEANVRHPPAVFLSAGHRSVIGRSSVGRSGNAAQGRQSSGSPPTYSTNRFPLRAVCSAVMSKYRSDMSVCTYMPRIHTTRDLRTRIETLELGPPDLALATELQCYQVKRAWASGGLVRPASPLQGYSLLPKPR